MLAVSARSLAISDRELRVALPRNPLCGGCAQCCTGAFDVGKVELRSVAIPAEMAVHEGWSELVRCGGVVDVVVTGRELTRRVWSLHGVPLGFVVITATASIMMDLIEAYGMVLAAFGFMAALGWLSVLVKQWEVPLRFGLLQRLQLQHLPWESERC